MMNSNCLSVNIRLCNEVSTTVTVQNEPLAVSVYEVDPLVANIRIVGFPLTAYVRSISEHIKVRCSNVCGVDLVRGVLYDIDGIALFDADNEQLFEKE